VDVVPHTLGPKVILHGWCPQRVVSSRKNGDISGGDVTVADWGKVLKPDITHWSGLA